jgi:hypothetical protein
MASYASANQPLSNSSGASTARRSGQFPPVPKSVRVLGVFSQDQPELAPERLGGPNAQADRGTSIWLWVLGFMAILGLVFAAIMSARFWNQLPI